ncbi:MAG: hypothetical protein EBU90_05470 [Proteobacteria bacterium]|nr:hypothetical protein [Pseudomonadota bacterium]NBP13632.1 hypothetical protein [bacterium]
MACIPGNITEDPKWKTLVNKIGQFETVRDYLEHDRIRSLSEIMDSKPMLFPKTVVKPAGENTVSKDYYYELKNIFSAKAELEDKLKSINKTPKSLGSEKKLDEILKKAGLSLEFRRQFVQLVNENPELREFKLSEIINTYLRIFVKDFDRQYYKAIDEPLSNDLEKVLIDYFDKFHITRKEVDNLKEKFGVDSIGVFDVLAKTIYYSKNRNLLTLPEEYGHVFVELLGSISNKKAANPLFSYLMRNIESWDGYKRVFNDYKDIYKTPDGNMDLYKIKKEAIGQAIGIALVRNYKVQKGDQGFWAKIQEVIDYILNLVGGIDYISLNTTVDSIAKDILSRNYSKLDRLGKDTSNYNLLSFSETIKYQNKKDGGIALNFLKQFSAIGNIITGSLAYRLQGSTYRPEIDALHDIDMIIPYDVHGIDLNISTYLSEEDLEKNKMYRKLITEGNYKEAKKYKIQGNIRLRPDEVLTKPYFTKIKEQYPDLDYLYSYYNQRANVYYIIVNAIWSENQELKDRFKSLSGSFNDRLTHFTPEEQSQMYLFDFFLRPENSDYFKLIKEDTYNLKLAHFNYAFYEKLNMMGRPKDAYDYQNWKYFDQNDVLAPDFNDRLTYYQLEQSRTGRLPIIMDLYQGYNNTLDDREFNYFTLDKSEAGDYGSSVRKVSLDTSGFLKAFSNRNLYREEEKQFTQTTGKKFDILDNSPVGLETQKEFFRFLKDKGYGGIDLTGWSDSQYVVSFYPVPEKLEETSSKDDISEYVEGPDLTTDDFRCK